jgi:hypothetical protein
MSTRTSIPEPPVDSGEYEDLGKNSDYLEDLARILESLGGLDTLVQELIQNADDAQAASITFSLERDALVVDNTASFSDCGRQPERICPWKQQGGRACDLHAFRLLSSASKRGEAGTTGAFGIGFSAVYQISDLPELISAGQHIVLDETLEPRQRARRCIRPGCRRDHRRPGTRLILPWARESATALRTALRLDPVSDETIANLESALEETVPRALLFVRHLKTVEVRMSGSPDRLFERNASPGRVKVNAGAKVTEYATFSAEFETAVTELRDSHEDLMHGRTAVAEVAVPLGAPERGLLYAGLPTHDHTGFPFHANAEFFPADDRRSLRWNSPPQARWNAAAIEAAGHALATAIEQWRDDLQAKRFWASLRSTAGAARSAQDDVRGQGLKSLWAVVKERVSEAEVVKSRAGEWLTPGEARMPAVGVAELAEDVLSGLGVNLVHPDISADVAVLKTEIPVPWLTLEEVLDAIRTIAAVGRICRADELTAPLDDAEVREALLRTLVKLSEREGGTLESLRDLTLVPAANGLVGPLNQLYLCPAKAQPLFVGIDPGLTFLDEAGLQAIEPGLAASAPEWNAEAAVENLAERLAEGGIEVPEQLLDEAILWLAEHDSEIEADSDLVGGVKALPIWPTTEGRQSLAGVVLPSGRLDRLPLADTVDLESISAARPFLRKTLGVKPLDLATYCCEVLPKRFEGEVTTAQRREVLDTLGHIKPEIISNEEVRNALQPLGLVECRDGKWRPVDQAYLPSTQLGELLGPGYPEAALDSSKNSLTRDLLEWLGLADRARAEDLLKRIEQLTTTPPNAPARESINGLLDHLAERADEWEDDFLAALKAHAWMTADGEKGWHQPPALYQRENRNWFASQAKFSDAPNQRLKTEFLRTLGLETVPPADLVTKHLLVLSNRGEAAPWTLYDFLDSHVTEAKFELLGGERCILVAEDGIYARTDEVFALRHPFGSRRWLLPARLRSNSRLLDALEIAPQPNAFDAKAVLEEIGSELDPADDLTVVHACWRMLQQALDSGDSDEVPDLESLGSLTIAIDASGTLKPPGSLVFNDAPSLADRLGPRVERRLIARQEDTWRALEAAGVQSLSDAVDPEILGAVGESLDPALIADRVHGRAGLFARVIDANLPGEAGSARGHAKSLRIEASTELRVRYHLDDDSDEVYRVGALYDREGDTLHVTVVAGTVAWTECAKELAHALAPSLPPHVIAASLRAVLAADTAAEADALLNELDVPQLEGQQEVDWEEAGEDWSEDADEEEHDPEAVEVPTEETASEEEASEELAAEEEPEEDAHPDTEAPREWSSPDSPDGSSEGESPTGERPGQGALGLGASARRSAHRREPRTPSSPLGTGYLETFLVVSPKTSKSDIASREELENLDIDRAGTNAVVRHEESCGREAIRKAHNFPGYDIESYRGEELERIIEVKSIDGPWDAARARLSKEQFKTANEYEDLYWLYVVEHARTTPVVWRIQDPGRRVHGFAYIPDWKRLCEDIPDSGLPESDFGD